MLISDYLVPECIRVDVQGDTKEEVLKELVDGGELVLTYRDPCSYVEIPVEESHHAARPMKVIPNKSGEYFICDDDADPSGDLLEQGCWRCGDLAFTPSD